MGRWVEDREQYTLAGLARRAGIGEARAHALYRARPSGLPRPDDTDADGQPRWTASTIDAWCAEPAQETDVALWLFQAPPAGRPAVRLRREVLTCARTDDSTGESQQLYVIVWDTERGHVIYLQPLGPSSDHRDRLAAHAAELLAPRWWPTAAVVMPLEQSMPMLAGVRAQPRAYVYRLRGGPRAVWEGQLELVEIATALGQPVPVWLAGTTTRDNAERSIPRPMAAGSTLTVPDEITKWPAARERLTHAVRAGMAREYPAGFAALAVHTNEIRRTVHAAHERMADSGPGWYLICRPARPSMPAVLKHHLTRAAPVADIALVESELAELRAAEGELDHDDPLGEVYSEAIRLLAGHLRRAAKEAMTLGEPRHDHVAVADLARHSAPWQGPTVEAWRATLTPIEDLGALLRRRRIRRLVDPRERERVRQGYQDIHGRYVLVAERSFGLLWSIAEWPLSPRVASTWTDNTVLAADAAGGTVTLLALTPTEDGQLRTDPVPLPPRAGREAFGYGYSGATPSMTYRALLRCVLGDRPHLGPIAERARRLTTPDGDPVSHLWQALSTTTGPLRLPWPHVQAWARADATLGTPPQPPPEPRRAPA